MSDEDPPTFAPPIAAIPSRAGITPAPQPSTFDEPLSPVTVHVVTPNDSLDPTRKKKMKKAQALPLKRGRGRPSGSKNKPRDIVGHAATEYLMEKKRAPGRPRKDNGAIDPLHVLLRLVSELNKQELAAIENIARLPAQSRKRAVAALSQVYG